MIICPECKGVMTYTYRFTQERNCELYVCNKCHFETKPKRLKFGSLEITLNKPEKKGKVKNVQGRSETGRKVYRHGKRKGR